MALREINFIPIELVARRSLLRHLFFWTGCMVISLSLIWGFYFYHEHTLQAKRRTVTTLKQRHANLGTKIDEIKQIRQEVERLRQKQAGLETITRNEPYSQIFAKLADIMNEDTWLSQLAIDSGFQVEAEVETGLRLTGYSLSAEELGNFLTQLTNESMFKNVVLQRATESETSGLYKNMRQPIRLIQFQIVCSVPRV
jgi:Tfp pilus assembly protein PilN